MTGLISKLKANLKPTREIAWRDAVHHFAEVYPEAMWVGILLPELVGTLPQVGSDDGYIPHITLFYADFGEQPVEEYRLAQLVSRIADTSAWREPLTGTITGYGRFYGEDEQGDPVFAVPTIAGLDGLRADIAGQFYGFDIDRDEGWVPHITLGYIPAGSDMPTLGIPEVTIAATRLTVIYAGREATIPIGDSYLDAPYAMGEGESGARVFAELAPAEVPEWLPVLPKPAVYQHPTYGTVDVSIAARDEMIANFNAKVYGQKDIPVDVAHLPQQSGCAGFITELRINDDGSVDGRFEPTDIGVRMISANRVRYVSPSWFTTWTDYSTDPLNPTEYSNVLVGLALTPRPFFKESALRPIAASEEPVTDRREHTDMADDKATGTDAAKNEGAQITEQKFGEMIADRDKTIREFSDRLKAVEDENNALKTAAQERSFREEVEGRSADNGARYLGDLDVHIDMLKSLPDDKRQVYMEMQRNQAKAARAFAVKPERGSDAFHDSDPNGQIEARAKEIQAAEPKLTIYQARARAMQQVFAENPAAYKELRAN